jgi:hypothetical protein
MTIPKHSPTPELNLPWAIKWDATTDFEGDNFMEWWMVGPVRCPTEEIAKAVQVAVNSHAGLVEALRAALADHETMDAPKPVCSLGTLAKIRAALAAAGETP